LDVSLNELFIRLRKVNNAFDDPDDVREAASKNTQHELNNSLSGIAEDELMNT
jgi:hypothetical protein